MVAGVGTLRAGLSSSPLPRSCADRVHHGQVFGDIVDTFVCGGIRAVAGIIGG